jgi:hypothetical protein
MSSSSRPRGDRRPAALAAALTACLSLGLGGVAAGADLTVVTVLTSADGAQARMLVDLRPAPDPPVPADSITVTADGARLPVTATPLLSDRLALALVVDTSATGATALPPGLSGAANLLLQLPAAARVSAIGDTNPPTVLAPPAPGPAAIVRALTGVRPAGTRQTEAALSLAVRQLPATVTGPRVLVLYTGAATAGGEPAADLAAQLVRAGVVLAVVSTATDPAYWSQATAGTGGALVVTRPAGAIGAFDTIANLLRTRYQLTFAMPQPAPTSVTIAVDAGGATQTAQAELPSVTAAAAPPTDSRSHRLRWTLIAAIAVLVGANAAWLLARARTGRSARPATAGPAPYAPAPPDPAPPDPTPPDAVRPDLARLDAAPLDAAPAAPAPDGPAPDGSTWGGPAPGESAEHDLAPSSWGQDGQAPGDPPAGDPAPGDPAPGDPAPVQPVPGEPEPGEPAPGEPTPSDAAPGQPAPGEPEPGDPTPGQPAPGEPGPAGYEQLDAMVAVVAAAVEAGQLDHAHAVARIALVAPGRTDLLDRLTASERRIAGFRLASWPPTSTVLGLLGSARLVTNGEAVLTGPGGIRVEQTAPPDGDPNRRTVLRLTRRDHWICDCRTAAELAAHVEVDSLAADRTE